MCDVENVRGAFADVELVHLHARWRVAERTSIDPDDGVTVLPRLGTYHSSDSTVCFRVSMAGTQVP